MIVKNLLCSEAIAVFRAMAATGRWTNSTSVKQQMQLEYGISGIRLLKNHFKGNGGLTLGMVMKLGGEALRSGQLDGNKKVTAATYALVAAEREAERLITETPYIDPTCFTVDLLLEVADQLAKMAKDSGRNALALAAASAREMLLRVVISLEEEGVSTVSQDWVVGKLLAVLKDGEAKTSIEEILRYLRFSTRFVGGLPDYHLAPSGTVVHVPPPYPGYNDLIEKFQFRSRHALFGQREIKALKTSKIFTLPSGVKGPAASSRKRSSKPVEKAALTETTKLVKLLSEIPGYKADKSVLENFTCLERRLREQQGVLHALRKQDEVLRKQVENDIPKLQSELAASTKEMARANDRIRAIRESNVKLREIVAELEPLRDVKAQLSETVKLLKESDKKVDGVRAVESSWKKKVADVEAAYAECLSRCQEAEEGRGILLSQEGALIREVERCQRLLDAERERVRELEAIELSGIEAAKQYEQMAESLRGQVATWKERYQRKVVTPAPVDVPATPPADALLSERFSAMCEKAERQEKTIDILKGTITNLLGQVR